MTFLEALYGSQYYEIHQRGKDGNKGRLNGNLFLSIMIILFIIAVFLFCIRFVPGLNDTITRQIRKIFGYSGGKSIGRILAIPLLFIIYVMVNRTTGSAENFKRRTEAFMQYPDEIKKKANVKLLTPFFILLAIVVGLAIF
jgi:Ca2+/Na+ antiporter